MRFWICKSRNKVYLNIFWVATLIIIWIVNGLCCNKMVPISWVAPFLLEVWKARWYVGNRLHNGRINRWLTIVSWGKRDGLVVFDSEIAWSIDRWTNRIVLEEPSFFGDEISRSSEAWDFRTKVLRKSV